MPYPTSVQTFATHNKDDTIEGEHVNTLQTEVNAIEDGLLNATARLNSSNSTVAALSVTGGSTFAGALTCSSGVRASGSTSSFGSSVTFGSGLNVSSGALVASSGFTASTGSTLSGPVTLGAGIVSTASFASSVTFSSGVSVSTGALTLGQGQIVFPATQVAAAGANTLDDYEEGTWTPAGTVIGFSTASGRYTKIGRAVFCTAQIVFPVTGNASTAGFSGLPFTVENAEAARACCFVQSDRSDGAVVLLNANAQTGSFYDSSGGALTNANLSDSTNYLTFFYNI